MCSLNTHADERHFGNGYGSGNKLSRFKTVQELSVDLKNQFDVFQSAVGKMRKIKKYDTLRKNTYFFKNGSKIDSSIHLY